MKIKLLSLLFLITSVAVFLLKPSFAHAGLFFEKDCFHNGVIYRSITGAYIPNMTLPACSESIQSVPAHNPGDVRFKESHLCVLTENVRYSSEDS